MSSFQTRLSKLLSLVLRHRPEEIGIQLDPQGYGEVGLLLTALCRHGTPVTLEELTYIVVTNEKQRFAFSPDGNKIRASQGHSLCVDLGYLPQTPPDILFHGTIAERIESIRQQGLLPGQRRHVHLSADRETAFLVGQRYGKPLILKVNTKK